MKRLTQFLAALMIPSLVLTAAVDAQSGTVSVNGTHATYLAGGNTYSVAPGCAGIPGCAIPGGIAPVAIALDPGPGRVLTFSTVVGAMTFCPAYTCGTTGPDGPANSLPTTNLNASGSISGIQANTSGFLAGVFLGASLPASAPASLDFTTIGTDFLALTPLLGQQFFIGDGLTSTSITQQFFVPDDATMLYLGIADGFGFWGDPGAYDDNAGDYRVVYAVQTTVPEPSTLLLMAAGSAMLLATYWRRACARSDA